MVKHFLIRYFALKYHANANQFASATAMQIHWRPQQDYIINQEPVISLLIPTFVLVKCMQQKVCG